MNVSQNDILESEVAVSTVVSFSKKDSKGVLAHENNPMVIKVYIKDWSIKRVLIDPVSFADVLYWDAFKGMGMDASEMLPLKGTLVGFAGKQVPVLCHMLVLTV